MASIAREFHYLKLELARNLNGLLYQTFGQLVSVFHQDH
jgi:hypothetical protein